MNKGYLVALIVLSVLTVLSLTLNGVIIYTAMRMGRVAQRTLSKSRALMDNVGDETFAYTFTFDDEFPVKTAVPIDMEYTVPFKGNFPINTVFELPLNLGAFKYDLKIPINTSVPVDMEFTVPISTTFEVDMSVPVKIEVPVEIAVADTPFVAYLADFRETFDELAQEMKDPLGIGIDPMGLAGDSTDE
jgi:hypothetical protein